MPTSTVEDYLKCIDGQERNRPGALVPAGRIASSMNVAPGTVTAMMKTLADAGLIHYEPYNGVRLTTAGKKLATHVLRRHRLIELFLVQIMGMDWSQVHDEAEVLEHAVSDPLIDRIDSMLGHPTVDPHGDPIPDAAGVLEERQHPTLLGCTLGVPLTVERVTDQRPDFLQLLDRHGLVPGRQIQVSGRDDLAETLLVNAGAEEPLRLGFQAASRIFVSAGSSPGDQAR